MLSYGDYDWILRQIRRGLATVAKPVRAVLRSARSAGRLTATAEARSGEVVAPELVQHYGFASSPPAGAGVILVPLLNDVRLYVGVGEADPDNRPTLQAGEVAIYNAAGASVTLKADGSIEASPATGQRVLLAGGGQGVARYGDPITLDTLIVGWMATVSTALGIPAPLADGGAITGSSDRVEAG